MSGNSCFRALLSGDRGSRDESGLGRQALGAFTLLSAISSPFRQQEQGLACYSDNGSSSLTPPKSISEVSAKKNDQLTASKDDTLSAVQTLRTEQKSLVPSSIAPTDEQETAVTQMTSPQTTSKNAQAVTERAQVIEEGLAVIDESTAEAALELLVKVLDENSTYETLLEQKASALGFDSLSVKAVEKALKTLKKPAAAPGEMPPYSRPVTRILRLLRLALGDDAFYGCWCRRNGVKLPERSNLEQAIDFLLGRSKVLEKGWGFPLKIRPLIDAAERRDGACVEEEAKKLIEFVEPVLTGRAEALVREYTQTYKAVLPGVGQQKAAKAALLRITKELSEKFPLEAKCLKLANRTKSLVEEEEGRFNADFELALFYNDLRITREALVCIADGGTFKERRNPFFG